LILPFKKFYGIQYIISHLTSKKKENGIKKIKFQRKTI